MDSALDSKEHTFHIPVMGTGFTIDTPLKVSRFGISSVISLVDDVLIEQMRKFHSERENEAYEPVRDNDEDSRARRITLYLNLVNRLVERQMGELRASPFSEGSDIVRYYDLLPDGEAKRLYKKMQIERNPAAKLSLQEQLRSLVKPGSIDVNIMTKLDNARNRARHKQSAEHTDAIAALRGYALSDLSSCVVFSAGINTRLFSYITRFRDFLPQSNGELRKKVVLKVSDFRSAEIQGKFLAKRGIWVSEFRIESGLNCGGHAFATAGFLLGPVLEEFRQKRERSARELFSICNQALAANGNPVMDVPPPVKVTVQGGIGTFDEADLLMEHYKVDATGWGSPFLLVPEVTNVDAAHMDKLAKSTEEDVFLSRSSPLGIRFWNLRNSDSELERQRRIDEGRPGSPCPKGYLASNTEFTKVPICQASRAYQNRKLKALGNEGYTPEQQEFVRGEILSKSCICHDLSGGAKIKNGIVEECFSGLCPGPNIVNFSRIATLEEMVSHIYGRCNELVHPDRPHMFVQELTLYVDYLRDEIKKFSLGLSTHKQRYFEDFKKNLIDGIDHYRQLPEENMSKRWNEFLEDLRILSDDLEALVVDATVLPTSIES